MSGFVVVGICWSASGACYGYSTVAGEGPAKGAARGLGLLLGFGGAVFGIASVISAIDTWTPEVLMRSEEVLKLVEGAECDCDDHGTTASGVAVCMNPRCTLALADAIAVDDYATAALDREDP